MSGRTPQTFAKRAREQAVKEKREAKQAKKREAAERKKEGWVDETLEVVDGEGEGDETLEPTGEAETDEPAADAPATDAPAANTQEPEQP